MKPTLIIVLCFLGILTSCKDSKKEKPKPDEISTVYICTGESAKSYHLTAECSALSNCSGEIKQIGIDIVKYSREPCKKCFDVSSTEEDNADQISETIQQRKNYVYLDRNNVLHRRLYCEILSSSDEGNDSWKGEYAVRFIELDDLKNFKNYWFCSRCFSDRRYEEILEYVNMVNYEVADSIAVDTIVREDIAYY